MTTLADITAKAQELLPESDIIEGYPRTASTVPYYVHRPLFVGDDELALNGEALSWDHQTTFYCCAASPTASYNMAMDLMRVLQGSRVAGTTLSTSMGYSGAQVEGHYESQVTVQLNQGGL